MRFADRRAAGRALAALVAPVVAEDALILALPRGGVPVAAEVAAAVGAPLDVWIARKLGAPSQPELGLGAIAEGDGAYLDERLVRLLDVEDAALARVVARERAELARRARRYRGARPRPEVRGRVVVVVDDGVATGGTVRATLDALRKQGARRLVVAVPVGAEDSLEAIAALADEVIAVVSARDLRAVGAWYDDFAQTTDEEVVATLERARASSSSGRTSPHTTP